MIVVSNTSPLLNLALVDQLDLLGRLFENVLVPDAVLSETEAFSAGTGVALLLPSWVEKRSVTNRSLLDSLRLELHPGEAETIALAVELNADLILLDERLARRVAGLGLKFVGLLGLLPHCRCEAQRADPARKANPGCAHDQSGILGGTRSVCSRSRRSGGVILPI